MSPSPLAPTSPTRPRIGVCLLPEDPWREAADKWRRIEDLGADHGWTYDHLIWGGLPDSPWRSTFPFLTAAAMVTSRLPLGTFVASPNFRHPTLLAKDLVTLDDISGGRAILGLGAGGNTDASLLGADHTRGERTRRFEEFVPLLDRLLTEDTVRHDGEFYSVQGARGRPQCVQRPRAPLVIAANGPRSMHLAARFGQGWVTTGPQTSPAPEPEADPVAQRERWWRGVEEYAAAMDEIEANVRPQAVPKLARYLSLDAGGPPTLTSPTYAREQIDRAGERGFTDVIIHWPRPDPPYRGTQATLAAVFS